MISPTVITHPIFCERIDPGSRQKKRHDGDVVLNRCQVKHRRSPLCQAGQEADSTSSKGDKHSSPFPLHIRFSEQVTLAPRTTSLLSQSLELTALSVAARFAPAAMSARTASR